MHSQPKVIASPKIPPRLKRYSKATFCNPGIEVMYIFYISIYISIWIIYIYLYIYIYLFRYSAMYIYNSICLHLVYIMFHVCHRVSYHTHQGPCAASRLLPRFSAEQRRPRANHCGRRLALAVVVCLRVLFVLAVVVCFLLSSSSSTSSSSCSSSSSVFPL